MSPPTRSALLGLGTVLAVLSAGGCDSAGSAAPPTPALLQGEWVLDAAGPRVLLTFDGYDYERERTGRVVQHGAFVTQPIGDSDVAVGEPFVIQFNERVDGDASANSRSDAELETENALVLVAEAGGVRERFVRVP